MAPHLQKLCGQIVKHSLLPAKELEAVYRNWRAARPDERDNLQDFIRYLLTHSSVTQAQVDRLVASFIPAPPLVNPAASEKIDVELVPDFPRPRVTRRDIVVAAVATVITSIVWLGGLLLRSGLRATE